MHNTHSYNPVLMRYINSYVKDRNWDGLENEWENEKGIVELGCEGERE